MNPKPDYEAAIEFLTKWAKVSGEERIVLTAIEPDRKGIETRTFRAGEKELLSWLEEQGKTRNIYFHVNPVLRDLDRKAGRADVRALKWLHVDVDPRTGEPLEEEQRRALRLLRGPPGGLSLPTVTDYSGGGYQGFWLLEKAVPIDGDLAKAEDAKRYNLQIEILFGADACHNVDRIMRVPGTLNRPDKRKRKAGRKITLAEVIEFDESRVYRIEQFQKAREVQRADDGFSGGGVQVPGNVRRLSSVDDLPDEVSDYVKVLIVQGEDPDDPTKYPSRSEVLFAVCCSLVRAGCDDEAIFSVVTDPDFGISESVLDKGSGTERYALRQIERAREEAVDPWLRELNDQHAVIGDLGGKCRIISEIWDPALGRTKISKQNAADFKLRYQNEKVQVGEDKHGNPVLVPAGRWWLDHKQRRQYTSIVFAPGGEADPRYYNLWRGFACEARPGDCGLLLEHIRSNICAKDEDHYNHVMGWMATAVQSPDGPGHVAVVLRGKQGTGKSFFAKSFGSLWGRHFFHVSDPKFLVGSFNAHLRDCVVLLGDEAFYAGDKKHESILKTLVTEEVLPYEAKGVDAEAGPNYVHLIMASNESWAVPAGVDDRRFFVLDVGDARRKDHKYFAAIQAQLDDGGREALLHVLSTWDLSEFDVRDAPETRALRDQKELSLGVEEEWWFGKLRDGIVVGTDDEWSTEVPVASVVHDFANYTQRFAFGRRSNTTRLAFFMKKACPKGFPKLVQRRTPLELPMLDGSKAVVEKPYFYVFPTLKECRRYWDEDFGGPYDWPVVTIMDDPQEEF